MTSGINPVVISKVKETYLLAVIPRWHDMYKTRFFRLTRIDLLQLDSTDKVALESIELASLHSEPTHRSGPTFLLINCEGSSATRKANLKIELPLLKSIMSKTSRCCTISSETKVTKEIVAVSLGNIGTI